MFPSSNADVLSSDFGLNAKAHAGMTPVHNFQLENGLDIVVIEDHRTPVVTHMIWYRNGSADDPLRKSGIAHFLEHLMFKGTLSHPKAEFSNRIAALGGQENAFTSYDYTAYYQRVACEHLATVMDYESDRMKHLVLDDETVDPERDVVLEERRMRADNDPSSQLFEALQASLFTHHPYGTPIIGWEHEIKTLSRVDALAYYQHYYRPENAILVVSGDVTAQNVLDLARQYYGKISGGEAMPARLRAQEPPLHAHRLVTLRNEKVTQPVLQRVYIAPSAMTEKSGESDALGVYAHLLGGGTNGLLYRRLVLEQKLALQVDTHYMAAAVDQARFFIYAVPSEEVSLEQLERAIDAIVIETQDEPFASEDLERSKQRLIADSIYAQDNQFALARWYGASLAIGLSIEDVRRWPDVIAAISGVQVQAAARLLRKSQAVTGYLLPVDDGATRV